MFREKRPLKIFQKTAKNMLFLKGNFLAVKNTDFRGCKAICIKK